MSFIDDILHDIGHFFQGLFNAAAKAWNKLSPEIQAVLLHGSSVVDTINKNSDATPQVIIDLLQKKWPDLTIDKLKTGLAAVANALNIAEGINTDNLEDLILALQKYLATKQGALWEGISSTIAQLYAIAVAPAGTRFAAIVQLIEYVFRKKIKS